MKTEYYDEVDANDIPTGRKVTKRESHDNRLVHRCVAVFVFDGQGRLYVQEHKLGGNKLDHSVGGHVDSGEDYETAAYREMEEELSITGVDLKEITTGYYSDEGEYIHMFGIYKCQAPEGWAFQSNDEVETVYPMEVSDIVSEMNKFGDKKFVTGFIHTMQKYLEVSGSDLRIQVP